MVDPKEIRVMLTGSHPHAGKTGYLTGTIINGSILSHRPMAEVKFDQEDGGCFAEQHHIHAIGSKRDKQ